MGYGRFKPKNFRLFILGLVQVVFTAFPNVPTAARATAAWLSNQTDIGTDFRFLQCHGFKKLGCRLV
jgi:hypothetical protein